jgi:hypothetical protein
LWSALQTPSLWGIEKPRINLVSEKLSDLEATLSARRIEKPQYAGINGSSNHLAAMKLLFRDMQEGDLSDRIDFDMLCGHVLGKKEKLLAKAVDELLGAERL